MVERLALVKGDSRSIRVTKVEPKIKENVA